MTIDVGTGDGRAVLATAAAESATLAIGVDAAGAAMIEASRRAARPTRRGGLANAMFVVAAAESMPIELQRIANDVSVRFPWGSLLRGCVDRDPAVARGLTSLLRPDGVLELLLAPAARDRRDELPVAPRDIIRAVAGAFVGHGWSVVECRPATTDEIRASGSTWAKRLLTAPSSDRTVLVVRLRSSGA